MTGYRAPQFTLSDEGHEGIIKDHLSQVKSKSKRVDSIIRLLAAAVFLDKVNPHLVDILYRSIASDVTHEQLDRFYSASKKIIEPLEAKPIEAKPIEAKPIEANPIEANPIEAKPIEAKPIEAKPKLAIDTLGS